MAELPGVGLVTGAGSGIGQATALAFVKAGCTRLTLVDINPKGLATTRDQIATINPDATVTLRVGDTTDVAFVEGVVEGIIAQFGRLDYAVNCVGTIAGWVTSTELDLEKDHDRVMNVNYRGTFLCSRAEIRAMLKNEPSGPDDIPGQRGAIVHISSALALVGRAAAPAYCASKAAITSLCRADAIDYGPHGIRINCVLPGLTETPLSTNNGDPEKIKKLDPIAAAAPMGRWGKPREIADAAVFLCSHRASFIQGHSLAVDGGQLAT